MHVIECHTFVCKMSKVYIIIIANNYEYTNILHNYKNSIYIYIHIISSSLSVVGMTVHFAYYGLTCTSHLNPSVTRISTNWAKQQCDGRMSCSGAISVFGLTDPYPGCRKDFLVVAGCPNGHVLANHLSSEAHGKLFSLSCYTE